MSGNIIGRIEDGTTTEMDERLLQGEIAFDENVRILVSMKDRLKDVREPTNAIIEALETLNGAIAEGRKRLDAVL